MNTEIPRSEHYYHCAKYMSWTAVLVAAICGVGISFLVNLLNLGLGLSLFTTDEKGITTLAIGGFIWLVLMAIFSMFIVGLIAGRLAYRTYSNSWSGILHGFTAWSLALILMLILASHVNMFAVASAQMLHQNYTVVDDTTKDNVVDNQRVDTATATAERKVDTEKAANRAGITTLATFIIFFLGAIASCIGGHVGMGMKDDRTTYPRKDDRIDDLNRPNL